MSFNEINTCWFEQLIPNRLFFYNDYKNTSFYCTGNVETNVKVSRELIENTNKLFWS